MFRRAFQKGHRLLDMALTCRCESAVGEVRASHHRERPCSTPEQINLGVKDAAFEVGPDPEGTVTLPMLKQGRIGLAKTGADEERIHATRVQAQGLFDRVIPFRPGHRNPDFPAQWDARPQHPKGAGAIKGEYMAHATVYTPKFYFFSM